MKLRYYWCIGGTFVPSSITTHLLSRSIFDVLRVSDMPRSLVEKGAGSSMSENSFLLKGRLIWVSKRGLTCEDCFFGALSSTVELLILPVSPKPWLLLLYFLLIYYGISTTRKLFEPLLSYFSNLMFSFWWLLILRVLLPCILGGKLCSYSPRSVVDPRGLLFSGVPKRNSGLVVFEKAAERWSSLLTKSALLEGFLETFLSESFRFSSHVFCASK